MYDVFLNIHFKNIIQEETHPSQTLNNKNGKGGERFSQKRFIGGKHARVYLYAFQKKIYSKKRQKTVNINFIGNTPIKLNFIQIQF